MVSAGEIAATPTCSCIAELARDQEDERHDDGLVPGEGRAAKGECCCPSQPPSGASELFIVLRGVVFALAGRLPSFLTRVAGASFESVLVC